MPVGNKIQTYKFNAELYTGFLFGTQLMNHLFNQQKLL